MFILLLACKPQLIDDPQDSDSAVKAPDCYTGPQVRDIDTDGSFTITNPDLDELNLGLGLASCDLNGDGHPDLLVSGSHGPERRGRVGVFYGPTTDWPQRATLDQADALISGSADYSYLGYKLSCGDLDGDGYDDLIVGNGELLTDSADTDFSLHIWYGGEQRLPETATESSASATLRYDYGQAAQNYLFAMLPMVEDLDGDGVAELYLVVNDVTDETVADRILHLQPGRMSSGELLDRVERVFYGPAGDTLGLNAAFVGQTASGIVVQSSNAQMPFLLFPDPGAIPDDARLTESEHAALVNDGAGSWMGSAAVMEGLGVNMFIAPEYTGTMGGSVLRVVSDLEPGTSLGSKGHTVAEARGAYWNAGRVPDYNGDGIDDVTVGYADIATSTSWMYVLDGSLLTEPGTTLDEMLLDSFWSSSDSLSIRQPSSVSAQDLDGDGCSDLTLGAPSFGPVEWGHDQGLVTVFLSGSN